MSLTADIHLRNRRFISAITDMLENKRRSLERAPLMNDLHPLWRYLPRNGAKPAGTPEVALRDGWWLDCRVVGNGLSW